MSKSNANDDGITINVEYCGVCDYGRHCLTLAKTIKTNTPNATVICKKGRRGSFEVEVNDSLIYTKLQTMALPDYNEVSEVVNEVANGGKVRQIKGEQPVTCTIA